MKQHTLKINLRHIKDSIEENYFSCLDIFHRCLAVSLVHYNNEQEDILNSTILESSHYNSLLNDYDKRLKSGYNILEEIHSKHSLEIFMDMQIYLDSFIKLKHINSVTNIYCLTIDNEYNVVITNKQLGKRLCFLKPNSSI